MGVWEPCGNGTTALTLGPSVALAEEPTSLAWLDTSYLVPALAVGLLTRCLCNIQPACLSLIDGSESNMLCGPAQLCKM